MISSFSSPLPPSSLPFQLFYMTDVKILLSDVLYFLVQDLIASQEAEAQARSERRAHENEGRRERRQADKSASLLKQQELLLEKRRHEISAWRGLFPLRVEVCVLCCLKTRKSTDLARTLNCSCCEISLCYRADVCTTENLVRRYRESTACSETFLYECKANHQKTHILMCVLYVFVCVCRCVQRCPAAYHENASG